MAADDSLAILAAFNSPEVEIVGLTTIFGNVHTATATKNAFVLLKLAGQEQACCHAWPAAAPSMLLTLRGACT